jgi:hypothetical protein
VILSVQFVRWPPRARTRPDAQPVPPRHAREHTLARPRTRQRGRLFTGDPPSSQGGGSRNAFLGTVLDDAEELWQREF